ncbi:MAG: alpha/beta fold hydrolase [Deltaproteobacteria bacterium]|nr:alpha/beta fold hydrolase [Candidatus Anaeroferrophillus wilburensis]MBN2888765.1 alpha/beta fold hydrolase [Deltaproteobacteria bacterium]
MMNSAGKPFQPPSWATNPHLQTIAANRKIRLLGTNEMAATALEWVVDAGNDVRLQGWYSRRPGGGKGLVILLHGWEGSAGSTYVMATGRFLYRQGYDIFRLNLRDHGSSHHLNPGLFNGTLGEEVFQGVSQAASLAAGCSCFLVGFSLGGNFALRVGLHRECRSIHNLCRIICISPCLDPLKTTRAIDRSSLYRWYFLKKWRRSLGIKQNIFPELYDFHTVLGSRTCLEMTERVIADYSPFPSYGEYFEQYTLTGGVLEDLQVPTTVITAADDPVVPVDDFYDLPEIDKLELLVQPHGGHCGFLDQLPFGCWYEGVIAELLAGNGCVR